MADQLSNYDRSEAPQIVRDFLAAVAERASELAARAEQDQKWARDLLQATGAEE